MLNYMIRILGEHGAFNRVKFGEALWKSVLLPSITHACPVWMPLSLANVSMLDSWLYRAAKIVMSTKLNIPQSALLLELGWEPINSFINPHKIAYFKRLASLPDERLCKRVFNEMLRRNETVWDYSRVISDLTQSVGLDDFNKNHGFLTRDRLMLDVTTKSRLDIYQRCRLEGGRQRYLNDTNNCMSCRLKLLARTKHIQLKKYLFRMNMSENDCCPICGTGEVEDLEHFLLKCQTLEHIRSKFFDIFATLCPQCLDFMELSPSAKVLFLVGDIGFAFSHDIGTFL